jgi:DNA-binding XRE family transcriptional regulator
MSAPATSHTLNTADEPSSAAEPSDIGTPATLSASGPQDPSTLERMARLKHLVRKEGKAVEDASREVGVDPIVAQLWLRLPDDLWPPTRRTGGLSSRTAAPMNLPPPTAPVGGLRRVITCRVPSPAFDRLRASESPLLEAAASALETALTLPRPERAAGGSRFSRRPLALPVSAEAFDGIAMLAKEAFNGDVRDAAGWLIARGAGMAIPLPTHDELTASEQPVSAPTARTTDAPPAARFVVPPRRRAETRAPLPPDDSAPDGEELRRRRDAVGISQRDLAAASGLSRGLIAEVERGRRRHVLTRLRIAETLASLTRSQA